MLSVQGEWLIGYNARTDSRVGSASEGRFPGVNSQRKKPCDSQSSCRRFETSQGGIKDIQSRWSWNSIERVTQWSQLRSMPAAFASVPQSPEPGPQGLYQGHLAANY
ncbi:MAG: hypothetical protein RLZZ313_373 [Verrucomicrobiota bacterium]